MGKSEGKCHTIKRRQSGAPSKLTSYQLIFAKQNIVIIYYEQIKFCNNSQWWGNRRRISTHYEHTCSHSLPSFNLGGASERSKWQLLSIAQARSPGLFVFKVIDRACQLYLRKPHPVLRSGRLGLKSQFLAHFSMLFLALHLQNGNNSLSHKIIMILIVLI